MGLARLSVTSTGIRAAKAAVFALTLLSACSSAHADPGGSVDEPSNLPTTGARSAPRHYEVAQVKKTRYGKLIVAYNGPEEVRTPGLIIFRGKIVLDQITGYKLIKRFSIGDTDAILVSENSGGQTQDRYSFILVSANREPTVATAEDFDTADWSEAKARQVGDRILVELGYENGRKKTAELISGQVVVHLGETRGRMTKEDCDSVHDLVEKTCLESWQTCEHAYPHGSFAEMSELTTLEHKPGFSKREVARVCQSACKNHMAPDLDESFKKKVCGIS